MGDSIENTDAKPKLRYDWYQTDMAVVINIFTKGAKQDDVKVAFYPKLLEVSITLPSSEVYYKQIYLNQCIKTEECSFRIYSTKVEVKMKKKEGYHWESLEDKGEKVEVKTIEHTVPSKEKEELAYPSSCNRKYNWNKLEAQVKKEEEDEKPEGDAALNQLFQKIYGDGSDEVKRAMNKSFSESGGTVLSTNWSEVKQKQCEVKAPDGMEWKEWEK